MNDFNESKKITCPICKSSDCFEEENESGQSWLCINCGYTTNTKLTKDTTELKNSPVMIQNRAFWDDEKKLYWILSVINLPSKGIVFPEEVGDDITWNYLPLVDIPAEEQFKYPIAGSESKFYTKRLDVDKMEKYYTFYDAIKKLGAIV